MKCVCKLYVQLCILHVKLFFLKKHIWLLKFMVVESKHFSISLHIPKPKLKEWENNSNKNKQILKRNLWIHAYFLFELRKKEQLTLAFGLDSIRKYTRNFNIFSS